MSYFAYVSRSPSKDLSAASPGATVSPVRPVSRVEDEEYGAVRHLTPDIALQGIYEVSRIVTGPQRIGVMLAHVATALSGFLPMRHAVIVLIDRHGDPEVVAWGGGLIGADHAEERPRLPQKVVDRIVATGLPLTVTDIAADPHFAGYDSAGGAGQDESIAFVGVPVRAESRVVGVLAFDRALRRGAALRVDDEVRFITMVANLIGQAVRLQELVTEDRARLMDEQNRLHKEIASGESASTPRVAPEGIVGDSEAIRRVTEMVKVVAPTNTTVLLRGESGTGKELFARAIHELSPRKGKAFVKLNCAALSETVLESELFGHEKGAFTNAVASRQGRFELADGGTLFLDEIGEISASFQAKLLRVLQEGEFERVGGAKTIKVDVRIVCATNRDLEDMVAHGTFRADLYYRVGMLPIELPPLRERPSDIPKLAQAFVSRFNKENGRRLKLSSGAVNLLERCYFPGNVRELENCVRRAATFARSEAIEASDLACVASRCLSSMLWKGGAARHAPPSVAITPQAPVRAPLGVVLPEAPELVDVQASGAACACPDEAQRRTCSSADTCVASPARLTERERLVQAMETSGWVQAKAARILNLTPRQIGYALRKYGVEVKRF